MTEYLCDGCADRIEARTSSTARRFIVTREVRGTWITCGHCGDIKHCFPVVSIVEVPKAKWDGVRRPTFTITASANDAIVHAMEKKGASEAELAALARLVRGHGAQTDLERLAPLARLAGLTWWPTSFDGRRQNG